MTWPQQQSPGDGISLIFHLIMIIACVTPINNSSHEAEPWMES